MLLKDNILPKCPECGDIEDDGVRVRAMKDGKECEIYCRTHNRDMGKLKARCSQCFPWMQRKNALIKTSPNNDLLFMYCLKHSNDGGEFVTLKKFEELCMEQTNGKD